MFPMGSKVNFEWREQIGPIITLNLFNRNFGFCFCHHKKDRCFTIRNYVFPLCSRCFGILIGILITIFFIAFSIKLPLLICPVLVVPLILDGATQSLTKRYSNNYLRFITGCMFSVGFLLVVQGGV